MPIVAIFILAFTPGIFWLWLIYTRDKYRPEPRKLVIRTFILGVAIALPVVIVEILVGRPVIPGGISPDSLSATQAFYSAFVVAGLIEETAKFLVVRFTVYRSPYFDEPVDGIIYAAAVALGFASIENFSYMLSQGWQVIFIRGWMSALGHVIFTPFWGYALGRKAIRQGRGSGLVFAGVVAAILLHGSYDYFLFINHQWVTFLLFGIGIVAFILMVRLANRQSPYREKAALPLIQCAQCGTDNKYGAEFCDKCHAHFSKEEIERAVLCSNCRAGLEKDEKVCHVCGSMINKKKL